MQDSLEDYLRVSKEAPHINISKEALISAQVKLECRARSQQIVEFAIEGKLRPEVFLKCLNFITQENYQDIIEERAISKLCGYPLCARIIPEMPLKRYHISVKQNKVYDINDRKNFCSNICYASSRHVKNQIDKRPVWLRTWDSVKPINLLLSTSRVPPGEEITHGNITDTKSDTSMFTSINEFAGISLDDINSEVGEPKETKVPPKTFSSRPKMTPIDEEEPAEESPSVTVNSASQSKQGVSSSPPLLADTNFEEQLILKCLKEWLTLDTLIFLHGEARVRQTLDENDICEYLQSVLRLSDEDGEKHLLEVCRKLKLPPIRKETSELAAPLSTIDYNQLKLKVKDEEIKVRSFYGTVMDQKEGGPILDEEQDEAESYVMPLSHINKQNALRRKIFLNSMNKILHSILRDLKVNSTDVLSDVQNLVKTFRLRADNIVFKPSVCTCIAIILLKIISIRNSVVDDALKSKKAKNALKAHLKTLPRNGENLLNSAISLVEDIDGCTRNFIQFSNKTTI